MTVQCERTVTKSTQSRINCVINTQFWLNREQSPLFDILFPPLVFPSPGKERKVEEKG